MYESSLLSWKDVAIVPIILIFVHLFLKNQKERLPLNLQPYFLPSWYIRVLGTFLNIAQFEFYYGQGDMFTYYTCTLKIFNLIISNPIDGISILFSSQVQIATSTLIDLPHQEFLASEILFVSKIGSILALFTFGSYLGISIFISLFCFGGCWFLFKTFTKLYPDSHRLLAYSILFVPSVWFWGTTLMKDPLSLGSLCFLTYYIYNTFKKKKYSAKNIFFILFNIYIILNTKSYIILCFLPFALIWSFSSLNLSINIGKYSLSKVLVLLLISPISLATIFIFFSIVNVFAEDRFALTRLLDTSEYIREFIKEATDMSDGTGYDLGEIEFSLFGFLKLIPLGINVTLFRPYLWEVRKIVNIPSVFESLVTFIITIWVIIKALREKALWASLKNPDVIFCLGFSLAFAFFVGISTFNFGALARYKIPLLPFFFTALVIIYHSASNHKKHLS